MADGIVVVDTDVVSFFFRQDTRAELYLPHMNGKLLLLSFMTIAELDRWALERNWGEQRRAELERYLDNFTVRPSTRSLCRVWAYVTDTARRNGRRIGAADAWHAAVALSEDAPLVTHNARDFDGIPELRVITEAPSQPIS